MHNQMSDSNQGLDYSATFVSLISKYEFFHLYESRYISEETSEQEQYDRNSMATVCECRKNSYYNSYNFYPVPLYSPFCPFPFSILIIKTCHQNQQIHYSLIAPINFGISKHIIKVHCHNVLTFQFLVLCSCISQKVNFMHLLHSMQLSVIRELHWRNHRALNTAALMTITGLRTKTSLYSFV